jgi:glycosyltransferase involved in cell wall biosynthesis
LLGERADVARLVAALDLFCLSSSHGESFPIIVGEAMSSGIPCVVTDVGDVAWMVSETGQVVPPSDPVALAAACEVFLDLGPQGRDALGKAARMRVVDLFSLSSVVKKYEELYESAMTREKTASSGRSVTYQPIGRSVPDEKA